MSSPHSVSATPSRLSRCQRTSPVPASTSTGTISPAGNVKSWPSRLFPMGPPATKPVGNLVSLTRTPNGVKTVSRDRSRSNAPTVPLGPRLMNERRRNSPGPSPSPPNTPTTDPARSLQRIRDSYELITHAVFSSARATSSLALSGATVDANGARGTNPSPPSSVAQPMVVAARRAATTPVRELTADTWLHLDLTVTVFPHASVKGPQIISPHPPPSPPAASPPAARSGRR